MNILFVYTQQNSVLLQKPLRAQEDISFGISYIAAVLEEKLHACELVVLDRQKKRGNTHLLNKVIDRFNPGLICFTAVFSEYGFVENIAVFIKKKFPEKFLVLGGVHITLNPCEDALKNFDALCIGEGEYAILELADCLERKLKPINIPNLWIKTGIAINKSAPRSFISNLDLLPFPNRKMWQPWILNYDTRLTVLMGRGCPFNCTYCCNHALRKVSEGQYVRLRSPGNIIEEIEKLSVQFPAVNEFFLEVETLGVDRLWIKQLCDELYRFNENRSNPVVFSSNLRVVPRMNVNEIFQDLARASFKSIVIGLESGSETIRQKVLNRYYSNADILQAVEQARQHGIKVGLYNLVGLPGETYEDFIETLTLNSKIQPDWHATSIFFPYPGTILYEKVKTMGLLPANLYGKDERQIARIDYPLFSRKQIQKAFDGFHYQVYRTNSDRSRIKSFIYLIQSLVGHNFMAKTKLVVIRMLYLFHLEGIAKRTGLFKVFQ